MRNFTLKKAEEILMNRIDSETLVLQYPEFKEMVIKEFALLNEASNVEEIIAFIDIYKAKARFANDKIKKSGKNQKALDTFLPDIIKARIAIYVLEQLYLQVKSGNTSGRVRFNLWDGLILQKVLFKKSFERKPVSLFLFKFAWTFITNKKILMPLVNKKGIYCFYSKIILKELSNLIGNTKCIELGAGDGTLTKFLMKTGVQCHATDDYSWEHYINYPDFVEKLEAKEALKKYKPETVICSWPPPGNTFEKLIFKMDFVKLYIVIGSKKNLVTGDHDAYEKQKDFTFEYNERLSSFVVPQSDDNAVYIFRRKNKENKEYI